MRLWGMALVGLAGCSSLGLACTEVGCFGSLVITLDRAPVTDAVITVDVGDGETWPCLPEAEAMDTICTIEDASLQIATGMGSPALDVVIVAVDEGAGAVEHEVEVTWGEPYYPNGKACDGRDGGCRSGEGSLTL